MAVHDEMLFSPEKKETERRAINSVFLMWDRSCNREHTETVTSHTRFAQTKYKIKIIYIFDMIKKRERILAFTTTWEHLKDII